MLARSLLQLLSFRLLTFCLTLLLLRVLPLSSLGANLALELARSFLYCALTDGVRRTVTTHLAAATIDGGGVDEPTLNLLHLPPLLAGCMLAASLLVACKTASTTPSLYLLSISLECLSERFHVLALCGGLPKAAARAPDHVPRSLGESAASTARTVALILMHYSPFELPAETMYGLASVSYSATFTVAIALSYRARHPPPPPVALRFPPPSSPLYGPLLHLTFSSLLQNALTELDKLTLSALPVSPADSGV
jgi:hypothetical protein